MAKASRIVSLASAAAFAVAALASCGEKQDGKEGGGTAAAGTQTTQAVQLFPDDFKGVCSGAGVSRATAYAAGGKGHKAVYFETYKDDLMDRSSSLPPDWTVLFTQEGDAYAAVDLVACARRTAAQEVKVCDGYKKDDKPTQNKVRWHTATYQLSVMEAKTGKKLAETTIEATNRDCPMFQSFDGDGDTVDGYASVSDAALADFLRPHVAP